MASKYIFINLVLLGILSSYGHSYDTEHMFASVENLATLFKPLHTIASVIKNYSIDHEGENVPFKK